MKFDCSSVHWLYFQYIHIDQLNNHGLAMHKQRSVKAHHRGIMTDLDKCFRFVNLELSDKMLYRVKIKDLHCIVHGSYCGETKSEHDALLKSAHHLTVTDITHQQYHNIDTDLILVFRSGSKVFAEIAKTLPVSLHRQLFDHIISSEKSTMWMDLEARIALYSLASIGAKKQYFGQGQLQIKYPSNS